MDRKTNHKKIILIDFAILAGIIAAISLFKSHADVALLFAWIILVLYSILTKRYLSLSHLVVSTILAYIWSYVARENYGYNYAYITFAKVNLIPFLSWSLGLFGISEIFNHFKTKRTDLNFLFFIPVYWILLISIETYAFHVLEIHDIMSGNALGLPFCNCIHAPWWMRIVYFVLGPVYYALTIVADSFNHKFHESV